MNELLYSRSPMKLYDKLPTDIRDAILTEAAAFSTMLEGDDVNAAKLMEKAARLRRDPIRPCEGLIATDRNNRMV